MAIQRRRRMSASSLLFLLLTVAVSFFQRCDAFVIVPTQQQLRASSSSTLYPSLYDTASYSSSQDQQQQQQPLKLGEYAISLEKPLGMILEEREEGGDNSRGVRVKEVVKNGDGSAWSSGVIAPGDVVQRINQLDVSTADFDSVMDLLIESDNPVNLVLADDLGQLDMPKNVVAQLKSSQDAFLIDAVVRQAAREIRRDGRLGDLQAVEVVIGAGTQDNGQRGLARFFAILSTDGVTSYSCNVSATGVRVDDDTNGTTDGLGSPRVKIVSLSCAKDEGLGRTYDLIHEKKEDK